MLGAHGARKRTVTTSSSSSSSFGVCERPRTALYRSSTSAARTQIHTFDNSILIVFVKSPRCGLGVLCAYCALYAVCTSASSQIGDGHTRGTQLFKWACVCEHQMWWPKGFHSIVKHPLHCTHTHTATRRVLSAAGMRGDGAEDSHYGRSRNRTLCSPT